MQELDLEASRAPASTSLLKLASLRLNVWLLVFVGSHAEVLDSLTSVLWSSEQEGVASGWGTEGQLIQSQGFSSTGHDTSAGCGSESQSSDAELGNGQETVVIRDSANYNYSLVV